MCQNWFDNISFLHGIIYVKEGNYDLRHCSYMKSSHTTIAPAIRATMTSSRNWECALKAISMEQLSRQWTIILPENGLANDIDEPRPSMSFLRYCIDVLKSEHSSSCFSP
jgi:hypothetical protein